MEDTIIVAILALVGTLGGSWLSGNKLQTLLAYRLDQLETKVEKHNQVIERTFKLEQKTELQELEITNIKEQLTKVEEKCSD